MRTLGSAGAILIAATACFGEPDYEGRLCEVASACPAGFVCGDDGRCHRATAIVPPPPAEDAGFEGPDVPDAGAPEDATASPDATEMPDAGSAADRCSEVVEFPETGWQARTYRLNPTTDVIAECAWVEDLIGEVIDRDFGTGGPSPDLVDRFATRYTARRVLGAGVQTFTLSYDDGVRLFVDDTLVYEDWDRGLVRNDVAVRTPYLDAGSYRITIEHFEDLGSAKIRAAYERGCGVVEASPTGWNIAYYRLVAANQIDYGECFGVIEEPTDMLNVDYGTAAPPPIPASTITDGWAAVGHARRTFRGTTHFVFGHDDGLRVSFDGGAPVYDMFGSGPLDGVAQEIYVKGEHEIVFELAEQSGSAHVSIEWTNTCELPYTLGSTGWVAKYYSVVYDGTVNPPRWTLDRDDCRWLEVVATDRLDLDFMGGAPPVLLNTFMIMDLFGAEYIGRRTFMTNTQANVLVDDGLRVFSDGVLIFDRWTAPQVLTDTFTFPAGTHELHLEYFENLGGAQIHVTW